MRRISTLARHRRVRIAPIAAAVTVLAGASLLAFAQPPGGSSNPFGLPARQSPGAPSGQRPPEQPPPPPVSPPVARVEGRPITQADFDRIAQPYLRTLRDQLGAGFTPDIQKLAWYNVLDELIRREVLVIESQRRKIEVTPAEVDELLMQDPFFHTDGRFDPAKFAAYKSTPGTNYQQVLPRLREMAAINRLDESVRKRLTPSAAQVRSEWSRRSDQVRFKVLPLLTRDMPLEPETGAAEWTEYYRAHPDQFMRKTRVRLRYRRLALPAEGDSAYTSEAAAALSRGQSMADSLGQGTLPDTAAGFTDTGLFDIPAVVIPGLGRVTGLTDTLARIDQDSTIRVVGPYPTRGAMIVGVVTERQPKHLPPMREVLADVKRRADGERRRVTLEADQRAFYAAHPERWRGMRATLTRVVLDPATLTVKPPTPPEVDRWYAVHGRSLFDLPDSSKAWLPPLTDSLRASAHFRMISESRRRRATVVLERLLPPLRTTRDVRAAARAEGAVAETLSLAAHAPADTVFSRTFVDSLLASAPALKGAVQGPRAFGGRWTLWRIDTADTSFVPPYESMRSRSDPAFAEHRRIQEEAEARIHHSEHRAEFLTPVRHALDYVAVRVPPPDSVRILEAELRRRYAANRKDYRREEQVKVRHILFMTRDAGPEVATQARAQADSLLAALHQDGGDFADLARRFSEEPGAATSGGDLGWFGRGAMVKEFEEAAFALQPGGTSKVVKTQFGYHIIRLEDRKAAGTRPYEEVRPELRAKVAQARGDSIAQRTANGLRRRLALGGDARVLAALHGGVVSAAPIGMSEPLPTIGLVPGLPQDFATLVPGKWAPRIYQAGGHYLVVRLRERTPQQPAEFEEAKTQAIEHMKNGRRRATLARKVEAIRAALAAGASLDSLAAPYGGLRDSGLLGRTAASVPMVGSDARVVERAFAMTVHEVTDTLEVVPGVIWMRVEEKKSGDATAFQAAAPQIETELTKQRYDEWLEERKQTLRIEILRADLRRPRPSPR